MPAAQFIRRVRVDLPSSDDVAAAYPFTLPAVASLAGGAGLELDPAVTFLVGEKGSGKSSLSDYLTIVQRGTDRRPALPARRVLLQRRFGDRAHRP